MAARNDPDFAEIALLPPLADLLYPDGRRLGGTQQLADSKDKS
jgi:hypothetical protein